MKAECARRIIMWPCTTRENLLKPPRFNNYFQQLAFPRIIRAFAINYDGADIHCPRPNSLFKKFRIRYCIQSRQNFNRFEASILEKHSRFDKRSVFTHFIWFCFTDFVLTYFIMTTQRTYDKIECPCIAWRHWGSLSRLIPQPGARWQPHLYGCKVKSAFTKNTWSDLTPP